MTDALTENNWAFRTKEIEDFLRIAKDPDTGLEQKDGVASVLFCFLCHGVEFEGYRELGVVRIPSPWFLKSYMFPLFHLPQGLPQTHFFSFSFFCFSSPTQDHSLRRLCLAPHTAIIGLSKPFIHLFCM